MLQISSSSNIIVPRNMEDMLRAGWQDQFIDLKGIDVVFLQW
jgi:hypothetical protein